LFMLHSISHHKLTNVIAHTTCGAGGMICK